MREAIEFRIPEEHASRWLSNDDGVSLGGSVRKLELITSDPRMAVIGEADRELKRQGRAFFTAWKQDRTYTRDELESASLFRLMVTAVFEPAGEECGTKYDETTACPSCGAGATQVGPLFLDASRIPKGKDFAKTIAGELIVSRRVVSLFNRHDVSGIAFHPVRTRGEKGLELNEWHQLVVRFNGVDIIPPSRTGADPFDDDSAGEFRCPLGDTIGLNLLSEVWIAAASRGDADLVASRQFIGMRHGLLRPERVLLVSPKVWRLIDSERLRGCKVEVAHEVGG